jgi:hypothetical protein
MTFAANAALTNRELSIEELDAIAAGKFTWGGFLGAIGIGAGAGAAVGAGIGGAIAGPPGALLTGIVTGVEGGAIGGILYFAHNISLD